MDKATEPTLGDTQAGADTAVSPVTAYTFAAGAELRWIGVLPYTDAASTDNEGALVTFQIQFTGAGGTLTEGDIQYADATPELVSLGIGTIGHVLTVNAGGTAPEWAAAGGLSAAANETITGAWAFEDTITTFAIAQGGVAGAYDIGATTQEFGTIYVNSIVIGNSASGVGTITEDATPDRLNLAGAHLYLSTGNLLVGTSANILAINVSGGIWASGGDIVCNTAALATNATTGFLYIPTSAGVPTGTPASFTGTVALEYDTTNDDLYVYNGSWKKVALV